MRAAKTIPTIIGVITLVLGLGVGVFFVQRQQIFRLGASPEKAPGGVKITNISDTSFTISWITDTAYAGYVEWGESNSLGQIAQPVNQGVTQTHYVRILNLSPGKKYYFKINSGGELFDNSGSPWEVNTLSVISKLSKTISGKVLLSSGTTGNEVLVFATINNLDFSSLTNAQGEYLITAFGDSLENNQTVDIFVQGGENGIASAKTTLKDSVSLPDITLGRVYDFTNVETATNGDVPLSSVDLPENTSQTSRLDEVTNQSNSEVTLESVEEGGVVAEDQSFFGSGPSNTTVTILVESDPITDSVVVGPDGTWDWTPPDGLPPGDHKITISWKDALGQLHSITRSFEVLAAGDEGVNASPTPSPSPTFSPTPSPTSTVIATPAPVPVTGFGLPTLFLISFALCLLGTSTILLFITRD